MPWIKAEDCVACGVCVEECPVGAISIDNQVAIIDENECIRCGKCHDVCPQEAVRHDSERIPMQVAKNTEWAKSLLRHFETDDDKKGLIDRLKRYFITERKIAEQSAEQMDAILHEICGL
ncbi:MAG: 4Fe-4S binding protein [Lentisphaerae bacterium]|nr:4Fe-4S binding protein [Lentisphaerota bacterium]